MKDVDCMSVAEDSINKIKEGAFLTAKSGNGLNTMIIGWAAFGIVWRKPIMMVAVRLSRHTFGIIEAAKDFTVTVPAGGMEKEIAFCGSKSGREIDKAAATGLNAFETSPGIVSFTQARLIIECQKIYYQDLDPQHFLDPTIEKAYPDRDYHRMYLGEVKRCLSRG